MSLEPPCPLLYWSLFLLVTRCAEPAALVCPRPARRSSSPPTLCPLPGFPPSGCAGRPSPVPFSCFSQGGEMIGRPLQTR
jgi:hypothetical protein